MSDLEATATFELFERIDAFWRNCLIPALGGNDLFLTTERALPCRFEALSLKGFHRQTSILQKCVKPL